MNNVTPQTHVAVQEMVWESFVANSKVDRMQSLLNAKFAYNNLANKIHHGIAHRYAGLFGDGIAETIEIYNIPIEYGNIPPAKEDYGSVAAVLDALQELVVDYQNKLNMCAKIAHDNMDWHVYSALLPLIRDHNVVVEQSILLVDKIKLYGDNPSFDAHVSNHFWVLGGDA